MQTTLERRSTEIEMEPLYSPFLNIVERAAIKADYFTSCHLTKEYMTKNEARTQGIAHLENIGK